MEISFEKWWDEIGSIMVLYVDAYFESLAKELAAAAWAAARPEDYTVCHSCKGKGILYYIHDTACAPRTCSTCKGVGRLKKT